MIRLFTALELPENVMSDLERLQAGLEGARWQTRDNFHITLSFIGDVDEPTVADIQLNLEKVKAEKFSLSLNGLGVFSRGEEPQTLYAVVDKNPALLSLQQRISSAINWAGVETETRKYTPHSTLARLHHTHPEKMAAFIAHHNLFKTEPFEISEFCLFESHLTESGPVYTMLERYGLV